MGMPDGTTARDRLERLLHVLPAASRHGGASLPELAAQLGASEGTILEDIEEVTNRMFYHPGGWPDDVQILIESDRVRVLRTGGLDRPVKLSARETLCLALALRGTVATSRLGDADARAALLARAEAFMGTTNEEALAERFTAPEHWPDEAGHRETLIAAAKNRIPCAIHYTRPGAGDAEVRVIHPYVVAYAEGSWYTVGYCCTRKGVRVFRIDRVLESDTTDGSFEVPDDFDATAFVDGGKIYCADANIDVLVRYGPRVARWIRERATHGNASLEQHDDGSVTARHHVADPEWILSHVLQYGSDAEIVEPEELRQMVRARMGALAG